MRRVMLAATLAVAACGEVHSGDKMDAGNGSGSGQDAGADAPVDTGPTTCATAADCGGTGHACELSTHMCVTETLTITPTADYVVAGGLWWTSVSDPILQGTFSGPTGSVVQAVVGQATGTVATLSGNTWTVKLPAGSITAADTYVKVMLTDPSGGLVEVTQLFKLDTAAPMIALQTSNVHDERGDTIDFSSGEPVHTHAGANVDLATGACPTIYKYAYLMDGTAPMYGSQAAPNPLTWNFTISDTKLDPTTLQFRVRTPANQILLNWTALPAADAAGVFHVTLTRNGGSFPIAELGTNAGMYYLDVKARDWNSLETVTSFCWDHRPIPAPLQVASLAGPDVMGFTTAADSPISKLYSSTADAAYALASHTITQYTAEPIAFSWTISSTAPTYSATVFSDYVTVQAAGTQMCCTNCAAGYTPPAYCTAQTPAHATNPETTRTGTANAFNYYQVVLRDAGTNAIVATTTGTHTDLAANLTLTGLIPARGMTEAARVYKLQLITTGMMDLSPVQYDGTNIHENSFLGLTFTGTAPYMQSRKCVEQLQIFGPGTGYLCTKMEEYWSFVALDQEVVNWNAFTSAFKVGFENTTPTLAPFYVPVTAYTVAAQVWDTGDDDLPGPY